MKLQSLLGLSVLALTGCFYTAPEDPIFAGTYAGTATYSALNFDGTPGPTGSQAVTAKVDGAISLQLGSQCPLFFTCPISEQTDGGVNMGSASIESEPHKSGCLFPSTAGLLDFLATGGLSVQGDAIQIELGGGTVSLAGGAQPSFDDLQLTFQGTRTTD